MLSSDFSQLTNMFWFTTNWQQRILPCFVLNASVQVLRVCTVTETGPPKPLVPEL